MGFFVQVQYVEPPGAGHADGLGQPVFRHPPGQRRVVASDHLVVDLFPLPPGSVDENDVLAGHIADSANEPLVRGISQASHFSLMIWSKS